MINIIKQKKWLIPVILVAILILIIGINIIVKTYIPKPELPPFEHLRRGIKIGQVHDLHGKDYDERKFTPVKENMYSFPTGDDIYYFDLYNGKTTISYEYRNGEHIMEQHISGYDPSKYEDKDLLTAHWSIIYFCEDDSDLKYQLRHYEYYQDYIIQYYTDLYDSPEINTDRGIRSDYTKYGWTLEDGSEISLTAGKPFESGGVYELTLTWYYDPDDQFETFG